MSSVLEKLGSYHILTNLLPGAFFVLAAKLLFGLMLPVESIVEDIVVYYFAGFIISRIGSLVVEPVLRKLHFINYEPYPDYVKAVTINSKIDIFSETNNFMRSLLTSALLLPVAWLLLELSLRWTWLSTNGAPMFIALLIVLLLFSYRKQTKYVCNRIKAVNSQKDKEKLA